MTPSREQIAIEALTRARSALGHPDNIAEINAAIAALSAPPAQDDQCKECGAWICSGHPPAQGSALPERDQAKPTEQQGLFRKFDVRRVDGSDSPGGKHHGCRYFVLDLDHDQHAPAAMRAYAADCRTTHPELAADLAREFGAPAQGSIDTPEFWDHVIAYCNGSGHEGKALVAYIDARIAPAPVDADGLPPPAIATPIPQQAMNLNYYKVFFHGEFVGTAHALTEDEAVVWFANRNHQYNQNGLMAVQSN